ncbi:MAG: AraC family transcriptional regulator [Clostridia bacterium]|nr:AraC family transcriptional regulator [Clostridia bacterium]
MIYQNMILGIKPYVVIVNRNTSYPAHAHYETELIYCLKGLIIMVVDGERYEIKEGEAICIGGMATHLCEESPCESEQLIIELGPIFVGDEYKYFTENPFSAIVYKNTSENRELLNTAINIYKAKSSEEKLSSLTVKSELYHLFSLIIKSSSCGTENITSRSCNLKIDKALELVGRSYSDDITVNDAAAACGYGVSVFCNSFKKATGVGFHEYLNTHRIEVAKYMLSDSEATVKKIALCVGFSDSKSFCRAFKRICGISPGEYRKTYYFKE